MTIHVDEANFPRSIEFVVCERPCRGLKRLHEMEDLEVEILKIKDSTITPSITIVMDEVLIPAEAWASMQAIRSRIIAAGFRVANDWRRH